MGTPNANKAPYAAALIFYAPRAPTKASVPTRGTLWLVTAPLFQQKDDCYQTKEQNTEQVFEQIHTPLRLRFPAHLVVASTGFLTASGRIP